MQRKFLLAAAVVAFCVPAARGREDDCERMVTDMIKLNGSLFRSYGCYCGVDGLGRGEPKDYIDVCCQILNCCYEVLKISRCDAKATSYKYIYDGENIECYMANDSVWCKANVCKCDSRYSTCLRDSHGLFNKEFIPSGPRDCPGNPPSECSLRGSPS